MMGEVADQLVARSALARPFDYDIDEIRPLWLAAARERFAERREQVPALAARADDVGIDGIESFADLVPLLFSHDSYKAYPRDFLDAGRWDLLGRWLRSLSTRPVPAIDAAGVTTQDDWIRQLGAADFPVYASSGTSGRSSFLPASPADREFTFDCLLRTLTWQHGVSPAEKLPVVVLAPSAGGSRALEYYRRVAERYGDPARTFFLTDEPVRLHDLNQLAALSRAVAAGTATPEQIAAFRRDQQDRAARIDREWDRLAEQVEGLAGERIILQGFWPQQYGLVERLRARGHARLPLAPDTVLGVGGGTKGVDLPADFADQVFTFYGLDPSREAGGYGMSELSAALPEVAGRYRLQPWIIPLVLDETGTALATPADGRLEGRFAFLDLALDGRWGGLISGDRVLVDLESSGFAVIPGTVARYSDLRGGSDDRLTCAGTVDAFVRGLSEQTS
ncbi:hypothetical protein I6A84_00585 [Frankia sp. CNm7]|uniref:Uncharacterized protein n=1 Tax=Frankia nepalensis TaxID=1836974 RepID=A0A937UPL9_9ACTN|nr:hypothetical protein [Frankia nepalensis]MBL7496651.1 hypothetical protein [Frankia nepalensis]MBL7510707.1 hypothetical protein [Frankia nepalensis]MBL7516660.1 hypothetical protein [Frankia nepalensis]MBL7627390.1 hypothetical protein [Frankia nepalensis]